MGPLVLRIATFEFEPTLCELPFENYSLLLGLANRKSTNINLHVYRLITEIMGVSEQTNGV